MKKLKLEYPRGARFFARILTRTTSPQCTPSGILCPKECNWPFPPPLLCSRVLPPPMQLQSRVARSAHVDRAFSNSSELDSLRMHSRETWAHHVSLVPEIGSHAHSRSHRAIHYQHEKSLVYHRVAQLSRSREWPALTTRVHLISARLFRLEILITLPWERSLLHTTEAMRFRRYVKITGEAR